MVYELSGAERCGDVLYLQGNALVIDSLSFVFS